jgi:hypothetical protein
MRLIKFAPGFVRVFTKAYSWNHPHNSQYLEAQFSDVNFLLRAYN